MLGATNSARAKATLILHPPLMSLSTDIYADISHHCKPVIAQTATTDTAIVYESPKQRHQLSVAAVESVT